MSRIFLCYLSIHITTNYVNDNIFIEIKSIQYAKNSIQECQILFSIFFSNNAVLLPALRFLSLLPFAEIWNATIINYNNIIIYYTGAQWDVCSEFTLIGLFFDNVAAIENSQQHLHAKKRSKNGE